MVIKLSDDNLSVSTRKYKSRYIRTGGFNNKSDVRVFCFANMEMSERNSSSIREFRREFHRDDFQYYCGLCQRLWAFELKDIEDTGLASSISESSTDYATKREFSLHHSPNQISS